MNVLDEREFAVSDTPRAVPGAEPPPLVVTDYPESPVSGGGISGGTPEPIIDIYTPPVRITDGQGIQGPNPEPIIDTFTPSTTTNGGTSYNPFPLTIQPTIGVTTAENSPIGSNPDVVQPKDNPLEEVNILLDLFHRGFGTVGAEPLSQPQQPGVTVIPAASGSGGGSSSLLIWLAVIGIVITIGAHWYFNRKK